MRRLCCLVVLCGVALTLTGCITVGDRAIRTTRTNYNVALQQTEDEQLLLNLVRLRYRDRPLFLEATALTSQFAFAPSIGTSIAVGTNGDTDGGASAGISFEERPTVTYVPLHGADYVKRMLTQVPIRTLILLDSAGWSSERVFRTCLQNMNGLDNASRAVGPTPAEAPQFRRFVEATRLLRAMEVQGSIELQYRTVGVESVPALVISPAARNSPEFREFTDLLGLDPDAGSYLVVPPDGPPAGDQIRLQPRSFSGVLYFLSQSVEVPERDLRAGRVTQTRDADGEPFDWAQVNEGLMRIRSSSDRPDDAAVAVRYRGSWFYIADSDPDSKSTFSLLAQLYALQSGDAQGVAPLLTLPVGG